MDAKKALRQIMESSHTTGYSIAKRMGRSKGYVYDRLCRPTQPSYAFLTSVADACGYDLALVKRDGSETIILDPPTE